MVEAYVLPPQGAGCQAAPELLLPPVIVRQEVGELYALPSRAAPGRRPRFLAARQRCVIVLLARVLKKVAARQDSEASPRRPGLLSARLLQVSSRAGRAPRPRMPAVHVLPLGVLPASCLPASFFPSLPEVCVALLPPRRSAPACLLVPLPVSFN